MSGTEKCPWCGSEWKGALIRQAWPVGTRVWVRWGSGMGERPGVVEGHTPKRVRVRLTDRLGATGRPEMTTPAATSLRLRV